MSQTDENLISMSFDSMSIKTEQSSYGYEHDFYNMQMKVISFNT